MIPDPETWCQPRVGGAWYLRADAQRKNPRYVKTCGHCGNEFLGRRKARACSKVCAQRQRVQQPSEIPDWIDRTIWRPGSEGTWYKDGSKQPHVIKVCTRCEANYLGLRKAQFCSVVCASAGDGKSYGYAHDRVQREKGPARGHACVDCGGRAADWSYDGLDSDELTEPESGKRYSFNPDHYQPRCHLCHAAFDGHVGEGNGNAKLTNAQRREIRVSVGMTQQRLAERFGVTQGHVSRIKRGVVGGCEITRPAEAAVPEDYREAAGMPTLATEAEAWLREREDGAA